MQNYYSHWIDMDEKMFQLGYKLANMEARIECDLVFYHCLSPEKLIATLDECIELWYQYWQQKKAKREIYTVKRD